LFLGWVWGFFLGVLGFGLVFGFFKGFLVWVWVGF
jgi:hypothetical protein